MEQKVGLEYKTSRLECSQTATKDEERTSKNSTVNKAIEFKADKMSSG